jgi:hypothetical protein
LPLDQLHSGTICRRLLDQLIDAECDRKHGYPLASCLYAIWSDTVNCFVHRTWQVESIDERSNDMLSAAKSCPSFVALDGDATTGSIPLTILTMSPFCYYVIEFTNLVAECKEVESTEEKVMLISCQLSNNAMQHTAVAVDQHKQDLYIVRKKLVERRNVADQTRFILLDPDLETKLDSEIQKFDWLVSSACFLCIEFLMMIN